MSKGIKTFFTDVLVVGGGGAGLYAANKAAEKKLDVLVVDRLRAGVGANNTGLAGGGWTMHWPDDDLDEWCKWSVEDGQYLNDQEWTYIVAKERYDAATELFSWGVPFLRDEYGNILRFFVGTKAGGGGGWPRTSINPMERLLPIMLKRALEKGVKVLNKVYIADLLQANDGTVIGAVGFNTWTGERYAFLSKSTVLACGGCGYKSHPLFLNPGQGPLLAYNAGAQLRNAEFCYIYMPCEKETQTWLRPGLSFVIENAKGENLAAKYFPERMERGADNFPLILRAMYEEVRAGQGPCYCSLIGKDDYIKAYDEALHASTVFSRGYTVHYLEAMKQRGIDVTKERVEWEPSLMALGGPVRVDTDCATTVPGLYAAGDTCCSGASWDGGVATGGHSGTPLPFAMLSGRRAGIAAARSASTAAAPQASSGEIARLTDKMFAPLGVKEGYGPYEAIEEIQKVVVPLKYHVARNKDLLEEALSKIEGVKSRVAELSAKDTHELVRCHEVQGMACNAEAMYRAALMRTETRGSHYREDYPDSDDRNWIKWVVIGKEDKGMKLWTEPVPLDIYKHKPAVTTKS